MQMVVIIGGSSCLHNSCMPANPLVDAVVHGPIDDTYSAHVGKGPAVYKHNTTSTNL